MRSPLTHVLLKIFASGFYRAHGGILFFLFLVLFGLADPKEMLSYHEALMLAFITSPLMMGVVFLIWLVYTFKSWHYIAGQIFAINQQFLFYSSNAYQKSKQLVSWFLLQVTVSLPVLAYGGISIGVAVKHHYFLAAVSILVFLLAMLSASAWFYVTQVNRLIDGSKQSVILKFTRSWRKPYFSLYVYHVFDKLKVTWVITKGLSYLIITGVFLMFADVSHDIRVAGIAVLAIAVAHTVIIFEERNFEETFLVFSRNLPFSRPAIFGSFIAVYFILLTPEFIWMLTRFQPFMALGLMAFCLSAVLLYHSLLYWLGADMEKYLTRVMGIFILLFWLVMFKLIWILVLVNLSVAYLIFFSNYYDVPKNLTEPD